jgi:purine-cytosine permease-like protein
VAIGSFGAIGQAMWLRHNLVDTYPFKMMGSLSPLYNRIGEVGAIISPAVAIAAIFIFLSSRKYWLPVVPVVACPLVFCLVFEYFLWRSPYSSTEMAQPQFDHYTGDSVRWLFVRTSLVLSVAGLLIGLASGKLISLTEGLLPEVPPRKRTP